MRPLALQAARRGCRYPASAVLSHWARPGCQSLSAAGRCRHASSSQTTKPYYITTPIFYVNSAPHIGHLYSMVLADVLKRWQQLHGREAFLSTGTDEHGLKVQQAAEQEKVQPQEFCDANAAKFNQLARVAGVSHDAFIRTTDEKHKEAVKSFWLQMKSSLPKKLGLYKGTHEGWYCVGDECFYPEKLVQPFVEPQTGKKIMVSTETGNEVEWIKEETWFFPMSEYKMRLLDFYDKNPQWITPKVRMKEVREWVLRNLEDLAITRPALRLGWGIRNPDDDGQTIYVWVDALINYLTTAGYGPHWHAAGAGAGKGTGTGMWPADLHVIGKDILRFHAVYWPALLMALELPLPKGILCHNHWMLGNRKMSKSLGNVVDPFLAMQRWDPDPLRYFLMVTGNLSKDMSYSNQVIQTTYVKDLQATVGNLFYRVCKPKCRNSWSTMEVVADYRTHGFRELLGLGDPSQSLQHRFTSLEAPLKRAAAAVAFGMNKGDVSAGLKEIRDLLRETNRYMTDTEPWNLASDPSPRARQILHLVIFNSAEALRIAGILLQPVMPTKASELLDALGVKPERRTMEWAQRGKDDSYGTVRAKEEGGPRRKKWDTLFPPTVDTAEWTDQVPAQLKGVVKSKTYNKMNQLVEAMAWEARLGEKGVAKLSAEEAMAMDREQQRERRREA